MPTQIDQLTLQTFNLCHTFSRINIIKHQFRFTVWATKTNYLEKRFMLIKKMEVWLWLSANGGWLKIQRLENLFGGSELTNDLCKLNGGARTHTNGRSKPDTYSACKL
jgi:hypothetical protein